MRTRLGFVLALAAFGVVLGVGQVRADDDHAAPSGEEHHEAAAPAGDEHHEAAPAGEEHAAPTDEAHHEAEAAEHHEADHHDAEAAEHHGEEHADADDEHEGADAADPDDMDEDELADAKISMFDVDGEGKDDPALKAEYDEAFKGIPATIDTDEVDQELEARPAASNMMPSMTAEQFRKAVRAARKVVLSKMDKQMARKNAKRMNHFAIGISLFSLTGLLILLMPLALRKKYPGQGGVLFKYSALAALTFIVSVNLFGGVMVGVRGVQGALSSFTDPKIAIATGTFDTLDDHAEKYLTMGKQLFAPTLEQMRGNSDEQPAALILQNGQKIIKDAKVFLSIKKMFKKVDFIFDVLPIVLFGVTMVLFGLAIRPTLTSIIKLPMRAAQGHGGVGREVTSAALREILASFKATLCTIGVLVVLTVLSSVVLGVVVAPALDTLLVYFSRSVSYLQFVEGASSGLVFVALFGAVLFLVMNLAALILGMSFFLGKCQKIFQARFQSGVPLSTHARYFKWGSLSVALIHVLPIIFVVIADRVLEAIDSSMFDGTGAAADISWTKYMLSGPMFLVVGFGLFFWAARGFKALGFIKSYKLVPTPEPAPSAENTQAM